MKKLLVFLSILFLSTASFAQDLSNQFYFRFGYSSPSWSQYGLSKNTMAIEGFDKKTGGSFELGSIFMLKRILKSKNTSLGINVDYLYLNVNNFNASQGDFEANLAHVTAGSKIGPSFTYSPMDKMAFDVYAQANFAWATAAATFEEDPGDADDVYAAYTTIGFTGGVNFRYGILILGAEFNTISPELESVDYDGVFFQEDIDDFFGTGKSGKKSKLPYMNFSIGLSF